MRILFALPGLHRVDRGAEVAFISVASELAKSGDEVTLIGSGPQRPGREYRYIQAPAISRERFERLPPLPLFRSETVWEEATFLPGLLRAYDPADYDVTATCSYPFTNWALRRPARGHRPAHVFVTQNGDWPAVARGAEYRFFGCDGLVCINPDYFERNKAKYRSLLIPNGVDTARFRPGPGDRERFGLPVHGPIPNATLVVAGDGPLRADMQRLADERIPGRYKQISVPSDAMPDLYRSADAVLHLSQDESFGNVYTEAMASGTPIVAYDSARTRWILGEEGFLAAPEPEALVDALQNALREGRSRSGRLTERAQGFTWFKVAQRYREFFKDLIVSSAQGTA